MATERKTAAINVLRAAQLRNENGDQLVDFTNINRDAADFATISRATLRDLIERAFDAGFDAGISAETR